jgi:DNA-binding IclR family transcriptional regulator
LADLKAAVLALLGSATDAGMTNAEIGRSLGIYRGHVGHEGHISRTLLEMMKAEGVVEQEATTRRWSLRTHLAGDQAEGSDQ